MNVSRLRIGVVGLGFGLNYMARYALSESGKRLLEVTGVCDSNAQRLHKGQTTFNCRGYADFDAILADPNIDAVALFSGPVKRAVLVSKAIRAGKHVMTTKPFELDPVAAANVLHEAEKLGKVIQLNSPAATLPADIRQIRTWQTEHRLGRAVAARWETWASYREKPDGSWYDDPKLCPVAPIFRLGIYAINEILYFLTDPQEVQVLHSRMLTQRPTPDQAQLSIRFKDGPLASVFASFCVDSPVSYPDRLVLNFERGVVYKNVSPKSSRDKIELDLVTTDFEGRPLYLKADGFDTEECGGHSSYQWEEFSRAVRGEPIEDPLPAQHIIDGVRIIAAMARSEQSGRLEKV